MPAIANLNPHIANVFGQSKRAETKPLKSLTRKARQIVKAEARQEAFEDLRSLPQFAHLSRKQLRTMAKKKVDGMRRELRELEKADAAEPTA